MVKFVSFTLYGDAASIRSYICSMDTKFRYNVKVMKFFNFTVGVCSAWCSNRDTETQLRHVLNNSQEIMSSCFCHNVSSKTLRKELRYIQDRIIFLFNGLSRSLNIS